MKKLAIIFITVFFTCQLQAEDGYRLWMRYEPVNNKEILNNYKASITGLNIKGNSPTIQASKNELINGLKGLLTLNIAVQNKISNGYIIAGTPASSPIIASLSLEPQLELTGKEGYLILTMKVQSKSCIVIAANNDIGILYGSFHLLRLLQTQQNIRQLSIIAAPRIQHRILNHWDNLDRHVERGYAGISIWNWHSLPDYIDQRYIDYARANASIGINGTVLTNVNANARILSDMYLEKVAALAKVFRPYGIRVYLTARFSAPVEIGGLKTADPLNEDVREWWKKKAREIYQLIPDFGGFLVKANSEGQPGPQNYGRTHADGANMLADAVAPHGGIVMWRAFVYSNETPEDRFKQAYNEFKPLDGQFRNNVMVQVKNGPIDFQPREPFHPLFGAMPRTPLIMEFQITQEYLGFSTHLVYLPVMYKEVLDADSYAKGKGSTVAKIIDGSLHNYALTGMAGVANIGNERNWCGHPFAQANWYAFGRLAWDHQLNTTAIAEEWLKQTFSNSPSFINASKMIMHGSHENVVNYMTPLGLHHIMGNGHHYGPSPWSADLPRADWNPVYYHRADSVGVGFDRTAKGSNALAQYTEEVRNKWEDLQTCSEEYLLWFHHADWKHKMKSGRTLWEELCYKYHAGADAVREMKRQWIALEKFIDKERFDQVKMLMDIQEKEAVWWRNACLLYFQSFSKMPIPSSYEQPNRSLEYYKSLRFPYAPGN